jgi:hypothetical protein
VQLEVVYFDGCPNWRPARDALVEAMTRLGWEPVPVAVVAVTSPQEAVAAGFAGSPTILVDGRDAFPGAQVTQDLACRIYPTSRGPAGCPDVEDLVSALQREAHRDTTRDDTC